MAQTNAGIAGALGLNVPRLTLVPSHCAEGISRSGAGFRVIHTMSGHELGTVAKMLDGDWGYICSDPRSCPNHDYSGFPTADSAAIALSAHMLDHGLAMVRARLAGEQPKAAEAS